MSSQQTVLRVQTNRPSEITITGTTSLTVDSQTSGITYNGTGTSSDPYIGTFPNSSSSIFFLVEGNGILYYDVNITNVSFTNNFIEVSIQHPTQDKPRNVFRSYSNNVDSFFEVSNGDIVGFRQGSTGINGTFEIYFEPSITSIVQTPNTYDYLDLYGDIPLTINRSFAEIQDIAKRNSDFSVGVKLPGSKKNNRFFESYFNVDNKSLFFDSTKKYQCNVLIDDVSYFTGYMKLNRISVQNSKVEYDVTLFSNIGDLWGDIGNNLLKDLDFRNPDYHFNHVFTRDNVIQEWRYETLKNGQEVPSNYFYPVMHTGYNYEISGNTASVLYTGSTGTSLFTTAKLGSFSDIPAAYAAGVERFRINSPEDGVRNNQLKPALNLHSIMQLIFKTYGYTIKSDFMTTPWMKLLYMYGYFSNDASKFGYKLPAQQSFGLDGVEVLINSFDQTFIDTTSCPEDQFTNVETTYEIYVVKKGTGIPVTTNRQINLVFDFVDSPCFGGPQIFYNQTITIPPNATGTTFTFNSQQWVDCGFGCPYQLETTQDLGFNTTLSNVGLSNNVLAYPPGQQNSIQQINDDDYVDFNLIIDENIKQIDIISSIAKKFGLLFIPDPDVPNQIIIEPYDFFVGTGNVYDWTDKLSWDRGFTVEPANNFIESELILTDSEDTDSGNREFFNANNRIYGENKVFNPTEFKSSTKTIKTDFGPMVFRKWNPNNNPQFESDAVGIPLGINYVEASQEITATNQQTVVDWLYKGVKTRPKLFYNLGNFSPFLDQPGEKFNINQVITSYFRVTRSDGTAPNGGLISPMVSHTMPMGNPDSNKINNDSICIMFNSEEPTTIAGDSVSLLNAFTNNDLYRLFYENRVTNSYDKDTRFVSGFFNLTLQDVKDLKPNDLIKINEQFFTWNRIINFKLTDDDLTRVELIQANNNPRQYPERYFKYFYCEDPNITYKFKTNFVGKDSIYETFYYYSILYDYFVGTLGGSVSGFTSSVPLSNNLYAPYSISEIDLDEYENGGYTDFEDDPFKFSFLLSLEEFPVGQIYNQNNPIWLINSGFTQTTLNVFDDCDEFYQVASEMGVSIGSIFPPVLTSGVTLNVTSVGWIRYSDDTQNYDVFVNQTGTYVINQCIFCESLRPAFPFAQLAQYTVTSCGTPCT
jgi:hypothetical protein